jgi:hypothetical protein
VSKRYLHIIIILLASFGISIYSVAQTTKITGIVTDSISGEKLPFVNVQLIGTKVGATTDFTGKYIIETHERADSILISYVGYKPQKKAINIGAFQNIDVELASSNIELKAVIILPSENPAHILLRKVKANKSNNSAYNLDAYQYKIYNKIQIDANNITEKFKNRRSMRPFQMIFENVDTSTINGKSYLPLLISEGVSDYKYRKSPEAKKEVILASRVSGINNSTVSQFLGNMYQTINVYDDYMRIFNKNFVSPIADFGLRYYRYYLTDSANIDGHWCYKIMFKPKRKQEATFTGNIWIADTSFAVKQLDMKIQKVNLNFVNAMSIKEEYQLIDNKYWMVRRQNFVADFNLEENTKRITGFYGHKTTLYKDYVINKVLDDSCYQTKVAVEVDEKAWNKPEEYWDSTRFEELNTEEANIYKMVDTVVNIPAFKNLYDMVAMFASGYYATNYFDFGPYFTIYSFNQIEGHRFRIGGRTSNKISDKIRLYGHLAYGTKDREYKYGIGAIYILNKNPRRSLEFSYKKDMEQLGESVRALKQDNILSSVLRRSPNNSLTMVEQYKSAFEYEYFNGFSNTLTFTRRNVFPLQNSKFEIFENGPNNKPTYYNSIITSEIELKTHFAFKEVFFVDKFNRTSLGTKYPHINLWYAYGIPSLLNSGFGYHKLQIAVSQRFNVGAIGYSKYIVSAGKIWGTLPYPILEVHPGNETFSYDDYAYNRMNYYEFISDEYLMANYYHNFQGLFFNHIPLIRKLKWREVIYGKVLIGRMSDENWNYSTFPINTSRLTKPYYEVGAAIENIFKVIRIDASWRLSYLNKPKVNPFGIMISMRFDF